MGHITDTINPTTELNTTLHKTVSEEPKTVSEKPTEPKIKNIPAYQILTDPHWDQDNINVMNWLLNFMEPQFS
jgi:hypothetical protein